ncbi:MAG: hypothetical protein LBM08_05255 [Dysgonamonadaceae bacterium]|jgi:hypothetical protein|nr:hypothetical protein [Dysgonamonadaceae bacterium]
MILIVNTVINKCLKIEIQVGNLFVITSNRFALLGYSHSTLRVAASSLRLRGTKQEV